MGPGSIVLTAWMLLAPQTPATGRLVENVACPADPTQTYTLYLPSAYTTERKWPVLFVFDPRGRGTLAANLFKDAAERLGWIVASSNNTRSDTDWEPNRRALAAMWPAVLGSYVIDERRIYAAGFSGGGGISLVLSRTAGGLAGIIAAGAPDQPAMVEPPLPGAWFGSAGRMDFNYLNARRTDERMARARVTRRLEYFEGAHQWMPPELAGRAMAWMEAVAMVGGRRPRDPQLAAALAAADLDAARALEAAGHLVDARRAYQSAIDTFGALTDVRAATERARALDADPRYLEARREDERLETREARTMEDAVGALRRLFLAEPPAAGEIVRELKAADLRERAGRDESPAAYSARRILEQLFVQTGFYLWRDAAAQKDYRRAVLSLEVATGIYPDRPRPWIDLAAMRLALNRKGAALDALERAVALGLSDAKVLDADDRLAPLRGDDRYKRLVARIGAAR